MLAPRRIFVAFVTWGALLAVRVAPGDERSEQFERHIRPLLLERCAGCHGEQKQQGEVRLDRRAFVLGADLSGPLVVPGRPDDSRLIQVIRYSGDDVQMPPKGKLPAEEIERLTRWVQAGAFWPEEGATSTAAAGPPRTADGALDFATAAEQHWSYRPLTTAPPLSAIVVPSPTPLDRYVRAKLADAGLSPPERADRRTLIRRATFDLWGLPPTWEDVERFVHDDRPDAWPRLIDRLLASPLYGQRWGRHWLDVARYADSKGYVFTENPKYPFSYTYRDYVVDAFNSDKPYDQFIVEQLAADQLGLAEGDPRLAAMGFLTCGPRFLNREPDIIDDRIDLVTRGLMGLTAGCARCHDHKYDPVPTQDYYSLYGVFASSQEPEMLPLTGTVQETPGYRAFVAELEQRQSAVAKYALQVRDELTANLRERAGDYLLAILKQTNAPGAAEAAYEHGNPRDKLVAVWTNWLQQPGRHEHPLFRLSIELAQTPGGEFPARLAEKLQGDAAARINPRLLAAIQSAPPQSIVELTRLVGRSLQAVDAEWKQTQTRPEAERPTALPDAAAEELRLVLYGPGSVADLAAGQESRLFDRDHRDELKKLERKVEEWQVESPDAPPRAMVLHDKPQPVEPVVFLRGDVNRHGDRVPRQPPRIVTGGESRPFTAGSGRLELAKSIASSDNPLTARVIVNRVWAWHFGRGLVATPSDFGLRGEPPTHPELLDGLAWTFLHEDGWSIKALHRRIMLSDVYQQSSRATAEAERIDPENLLHSRFPRQRIGFEPLRDSLLAVAGRLDTALAGRPVEIEQAPFSNRRSIYGRIDRNNFSSLLRTFDYPSPDATSPQRPVTTVPQQALYALNSPFLRSIAEGVAEQAAAVPLASADDRTPQITALYRRALTRDPSTEELRLAREFLQRYPDDLVLLSQSLLLTNEFVFVD
jgi:cytochrome c553